MFTNHLTRDKIRLAITDSYRLMKESENKMNSDSVTNEQLEAIYEKWTYGQNDDTYGRKDIIDDWHDVTGYSTNISKMIGEFTIKERVDEEAEDDEYDLVDHHVYHGRLGTFMIRQVQNDVSLNSDYEFYEGLFLSVGRLKEYCEWRARKDGVLAEFRSESNTTSGHHGGLTNPIVEEARITESVDQEYEYVTDWADEDANTDAEVHASVKDAIARARASAHVKYKITTMKGPGAGWPEVVFIGPKVDLKRVFLVQRAENPYATHGLYDEDFEESVLPVKQDDVHHGGLTKPI